MLDPKVGFLQAHGLWGALPVGGGERLLCVPPFADRVCGCALLFLVQPPCCPLSPHDSFLLCSTKSTPILPAQELTPISPTNTLSSVEKGGEVLCVCVCVCVCVYMVYNKEGFLLGFCSGWHSSLLCCVTAPHYNKDHCFKDWLLRAFVKQKIIKIIEN